MSEHDLSLLASRRQRLWLSLTAIALVGGTLFLWAFAGPHVFLDAIVSGFGACL